MAVGRFADDKVSLRLRFMRKVVNYCVTSFQQPIRHHSLRNAIVGSTRAARRAGM
jgi:hypothetical protein